MSDTDYPNLSAMHRAICSKLGGLPAVRFKPDGLWRYFTWNDYRRRADELAAGLIELGVQRGDRIAILSENHWEWLVADHAILSTGAVDVPIHAPSTPAQIQYQLEHSGAVGIIVSTPEQWDKVASVLPQVPDLKFAVGMDAAPRTTRITAKSWKAVQQSGQRLGAKGREAVAAREAATTPDDLATIIYTSGTTNRPKGVMLTQRNLLTNSLSGADAIASDCTALWFNWLPYSHIFARLVDHYSTTRMGMAVALAQSAATSLDDLREVEPSYFSSVPRLLEKIWAHVVSFPPEQRAKEARRLVGRRLIQISSGGAPLPVHVANDLRDAGIIVLEGYGLTETSPIISFNQREHWKVGTVGPAIPGVEVKIADDGEILTRGPHVMRGYWRDEAATAAAIEPDGWFHTGDIGSLDSEDFLSITGRKKDLIVTAGGKNVVPAALEAMLIQDPFIEQALVYGDRRPFCVAMIVPKFERIKDAVRESHGAFTTDEPVVTDANLLAWFQKRVDAALHEVSNVERAKKIVVLTHPLSLDLDEVTVTQKVRRAAVFQRYQQYLDALYQGSSE